MFVKGIWPYCSLMRSLRLFQISSIARTVMIQDRLVLNYSASSPKSCRNRKEKQNYYYKIFKNTCKCEKLRLLPTHGLRQLLCTSHCSSITSSVFLKCKATTFCHCQCSSSSLHLVCQTVCMITFAWLDNG